MTKQQFLLRPLASPAAALGLLLAAVQPAAADLTSSNSNRADGFTILTFTAGSGNWTVPEGVTSVEVLAVGGGGSGRSGGAWSGPGGGPGGLWYAASHPVVPSSSVLVTVGAGGASVVPGNTNGNPGETSQFGTILAYGGQGGTHYTAPNVRGANQGDSTDGVTIKYGRVGGTSTEQNAVGSAGDSTNGLGGAWGERAGGNGSAYSITGSSVYYAGGGGWGYNQSRGGLGGGGAGGPQGQPGVAGAPNTGGGGGGTYDAGNSGAGGSGVVIVAYPSSATTWTVTFDSNGGSAVPSQIVVSGATATAPTPSPTNPGYTFDGWFSDSGLTTLFNFSTPITAHTTLYAKWLVNYTVTFQSNGGSTVPSQTVGSGNTATQPANPTRTGYTFVEWCSDLELTTSFNFGTPIIADTMLYANWQINSYTLTYGAGAGGWIDGTTLQTVEYGASGTAVTAVPDSGYQFVKWSDQSWTNPRTDSNVTADIGVTAIFELIPTGPIIPTTVTTREDGYTVASFTSGSGVWTVPDGVTSVEVLVVGGGGSGRTGGAWDGPGGGPGGLWYATSYAVVPNGPVTVVVGAGGASVVPARTNGNYGERSQFGTILAYGGQGGTYYPYPGVGYSQGAKQGESSDGVTIKPGKVGGTTTDSNGWTYNAVGSAGDSTNGLNGGWGPQTGGAGSAISITGAPVYYAGGGGWGYGQSPGGLGGGGAGGPQGRPGVAGVPNTGGGGGGTYDAGTSGAGGSGVVIVAYQIGGQPPYQAWAARTFANAFTDTDPAHDPDGDGLTNQQEFAFGLDPTTGASVNPITAPLDKPSHKFRYTRFKDSGLTYTVWVSTDLQDWGTAPAAASEAVVTTVNDIETVEVTLTSPPDSAKLFVRVRAQ
ncbi:MAG: InlB B-repeat-containing protein [Verrucomicrobia bacterium]|nr:InlB B-repeat-containing protein [Verrucomicrobiota bacterium]